MPSFIAKDQMKRYVIPFVATLILGASALAAPRPLPSPQHVTVDLFKHGDLQVEFLYEKEANYLDSEWLGFKFKNQGTNCIEIVNFSYSIRCEAFDATGNLKKRHSLGQGNKYGVFPVFETKNNPSDYDAFIPKDGTVWCWRGPSHYSTVLLDHDAEDHLIVNAVLSVDLLYRQDQNVVKLKKQDIEFSFTWDKIAEQDYNKLAEKLKRNLDNAHIRGNGWIIHDLMQTPEVSTLLPVSYYKELARKREPALKQSRRLVLSHIAEYSKDNSDLVQHYQTLLPKADWTVLNDLSVIWDDSFLLPLVDSLEDQNKDHIKYLRILDQRATLWKNNHIVKDRLYKIVKTYASTVLVSQEELASRPQNRLESWALWCDVLAMTRHKEAEAYLRAFLNDERSVYQGNLMIGMPINHTFVYYTARRVCDVALEKITHINDGDLEELYITTFMMLNKAGAFEDAGRFKGKFDFYTPFATRNPLMNEEIMLNIRNHLIAEMKNSDIE